MDIFEIILGSYESFVIGVKCRFKSQVNIPIKLLSTVIILAYFKYVISF